MVLKGKQLLVAATALLALGFVMVKIFPFGWWYQTALAPELQELPGRITVRKGVKFGPVDLTGKKQAEIKNFLAEVARRSYTQPVDARIDPVTGGVIPEVNGVELDMDATVKALEKAEANTTVEPVFKQIIPETRLEHFPLAPIYQGNETKKAMTLVVNVSWGKKYLAYLDQVLDILKEHDARATFFLVGKWAESNPGHVRKIVEAHHELANHAYSDPHMNGLSREQVRDEIRKTGEVIEALSGKKPRYFSPPYGEFNRQVLEVAQELDYRTVLWTIDTVDWRRPGVDWMVNRVLNNAAPGAMVLMHPTEQIPETLRVIVPALLKGGYELVSLQEMLSPEVLPDAETLWEGIAALSPVAGL